MNAKNNKSYNSKAVAEIQQPELEKKAIAEMFDELINLLRRHIEASEAYINSLAKEGLPNNAIMAEILASCNNNISNVLHAQLEDAKNPRSAIMELLKCEENFRLSFREIVLNDPNSPLNVEAKNATSEVYRLKLTAMQTGYTRLIENITQANLDVSSTQIRKALDMSFNQRMIYFVLRETVRDARDNIVKSLTARFKNKEVNWKAAEPYIKNLHNIVHTNMELYCGRYNEYVVRLVLRLRKMNDDLQARSKKEYFISDSDLPQEAQLGMLKDAIHQKALFVLRKYLEAIEVPNSEQEELN